MMARQSPLHCDRPAHYSADRARGGEIILRTRAERLIFIVGLVGAVLLALALAFAPAH